MRNNFLGLLTLLVPLSALGWGSGSVPGNTGGGGTTYVIASTLDDDAPEPGDCLEIPFLNADCTIADGAITAANVDTTIPTANTIPAFVADTSTYVTGVTACTLQGQIHIETDVVVKNMAVCVDAAADTWLFYTSVP